MSPQYNIRSKDKFEPARLVERFAPHIARAAKGLPILDLACGSGRNADVFVRLGCNVVCLDKDLSPLESRYHPTGIPKQIRALRLDLFNDTWPFGRASIGGIINVHFLAPALFPFFADSLTPGGYLLLETVPGCGGNYLKLPTSNDLRSRLSQSFDFEFYKERPAGPLVFQVVTVRLVARRRADLT
jgi:SAM-dependent methyltransferase